MGWCAVVVEYELHALVGGVAVATGAVTVCDFVVRGALVADDYGHAVVDNLGDASGAGAGCAVEY